MTELLPLFIPSPSEGVWHLGPVPVRAYAIGIILTAVMRGRAHDPDAVMKLYTSARRVVSKEALAPPTQVDFTPDGY